MTVCLRVLFPFSVALLITNLACAKKSEPDSSDEHSPEIVASTPACTAERAARCDEVKQRIADLEAEQQKSLDAKDAKRLAKTQLELNHQRELLALLQDSTSSQEAFDALESKYVQLARLLDDRLERLDRAPVGDDHDSVMVDLGAILYHEKEVKAVASVMHDFGDLYVAASPLDADGKPVYEEVRADAQPWAGYWYPFRGSELFEGSDSPLQKLDRAMGRAGQATNAADTEREHRNLFYADSWEGLCASWAIAATQTKEPKESLEIQGVEFTPADQKALLIKAYELYPTTLYGIRYDGNSDSDGTFQDLRPEAFHRIFLATIGDKKQPFVIDDDAGIEVWSKPVFRVRWAIRQDPDHADALLVKALPWLTRHRSEVSDDLTSTYDIAAPVYEYRLYVDPNVVKNGKFKVIAGEWIGDSVDTHPDTIAIAKAGGELKSGNPEVNAGLDVIRSIIANIR